jgi:hypothetical protein
MPFRIGMSNLGDAIARAVGVNPAETSRIVIDVRSDEATRVRISKWLTVEQEDELIRIFEATSFQESK